MFDSKCLLSSKGPLGSIWVAAFCFKRLKKAQVFETDISFSVDEILQNQLDVLTYRLLAYLLLGLVRIYSEKVKYLSDDCHDVMLKIKDFVVIEKHNPDKETLHFPCYSITQPDRFELDAFDLEILEDVSGDNVIPYEKITLKDSISEAGGVGQYSLVKYPYAEFAACHDSSSADYVPTEDSIFSPRSIAIDIVSTSHGLNNLETLIEKIQTNSFSRQGEEPSGENHKTDKENIEILAIAHLENEVQGEANMEMHQDDKFFGVDEDHQFVGEQIKVQDSAQLDNELCKAVNEDNNPSTLQPSTEKLPDHGFPPETSMDTEMFCGFEKEHPELVKSSGEAHQSDGDQMKVQDLAHLENEMYQAVNEDNNLTNLQPCLEKLVDHRFPQGPSTNVPMFCGSEEESPELVKASGEGHHTNGEQMKSLEIPLSGNDKCRLKTGENPLSITLDAAPQSKFPDGSGATTPGPIGVRTPAVKERARISGKRKCCFDDVIVFPNNVIKQSLEDASDLVSKRRKIPYTTIAVWEASPISNLPHSFLLPSLPCISSELNSLFCQKRFKIPETAETVEPPEPESPTIVRSLEKMVIAPETPTFDEMTIASETPAGRSSEQIPFAPATPIFDSTATRPFDSPESHRYSDSDAVRPAHSFQTVEKDPSLSKDEAFDPILMNEEINSYEASNQESHELTPRTRMVARYLHRSIFSKRREDEAVNLSQLLEGKTKKESARFFYEILVLKTKGYVDVKQDEPYGDILVREVPQQG